MKPSVLTFLTPKDQTFCLDFNSTIRQVLEKMDYHRFTIVPLVDENGHYCGTLSEGDILRYIKHMGEFSLKDAEEVHIFDLERYRSYKAVKISEPIEALRNLLLNQNFAPVIDDRGVFIGIVKRKSVMEYFFDKVE